MWEKEFVIFHLYREYMVVIWWTFTWKKGDNYNKNYLIFNLLRLSLQCHIASFSKLKSQLPKSGSKWLNIEYLFFNVSKTCNFFLSGTATWSWRTWRRCGQKFLKVGKGRKSQSRWIRIATFLKCSSEETLSLSCLEILWSLENELFIFNWTCQSFFVPSCFLFLLRFWSSGVKPFFVICCLVTAIGWEIQCQVTSYFSTSCVFHF